MALISATKKVSYPDRNKLERFLLSVKCKHEIQTERNRPYTAWFVFHYLTIRTYNKKFTIHVFGDIDHYEVEEKSYDSINYNLEGLQLMWSLLRPLDI